MSDRPVPLAATCGELLVFVERARRLGLHVTSGETLAPMTESLHLTASGMDLLGRRAQQARRTMRRLGVELRITASHQRAEACIRLFHRRPSWWLLRVAMWSEFRAAWLEATRWP